MEPIPQDIRNNPSKLALVTMHLSWLEHNVTKHLAIVLENRKKRILSAIEVIASNPKSDDVALRIEGVRLKEINNTLQVIYDVQKFAAEV